MMLRSNTLLHASACALLCSSCLFHFDRTLAPGELRGAAVIRSATGALTPAANATATLEGSTLTITADSRGIFAFEGLPAGTYSVDVSASSTGTGAANFGLHLQNITIGLADGTDLGQIVLGAFGGLQGMVLLENAPVPAATAVIPGITQTPVTNGSYQLGVLLPGTYQLSVFLADDPGAIESSLINVQVNPGATTQVPTISLTQSELATAGAAQGTAVLSGATSSASVDIQFSGAGPDLTTNAQGQFSGTGIPAGIYTITASLGGFQSVTISNIVIGSGTTIVPMVVLFPGNNPPPDAGPPDAGPPDAGPPDAGPQDAGPPATPPGAPTNVMVAPGDGFVTVSWTAPSSDGGSSVAGYLVTSAPGGVTATTTGATSVKVTGLTNGQSYTFTVLAFNAAGNSPSSAPSPAVIPLGVPLAPTGAFAVAGSGEATVLWSPPTDDEGSAITGYTVTSTPGSLTAATTGTTSVVVTGLTNGVSYTFAIDATNAIGTSAESAPSNAVTPAGVPGAPFGVTAVPYSTTNGEEAIVGASVSWNAPLDDGGSDITGYTVTSTPGNVTATTTGGTTVQVTGLVSGTSYTFTVTASNSFGSGPASSPSAPVKVGVPSAPLNVKATAGNGRASVSFSPPLSNGGAGINGYTATASPGGKTGSTVEGTSIQVNGLTNDQSYTFTVHASNVNGNSPESAPSAPVTPRGAPTVPMDVTAVAGDGFATVSWQASTGDASPVTGYTVLSNPGSIVASTTGATSVQVTGLTDGTSYTFTVSASSYYGSSAQSSPSSPVTPLYVDAGPPPPDPNVGQDDAGNAIITYTRIPWGSAATAGSPSFSVSGVSGSALGDYGVVIFDNPDAGAAVLGSAPVDGTGAFNATLTNLDHPSVYIAGVTDAGVLSPDLQEVENVNWTATFGGKVPGNTTTNPHVLTMTGDFIYSAQENSFGGPLAPDGLWARETTSYAGVITPNDGQVLDESAISTSWTNITPGPSGRWGASAAYDSSARNLVLFGGCTDTTGGCASPLTETWFWGGQIWTNDTPNLNNSPAARVSGAMAYDAKHQQLVLFGGMTWDGEVWNPLGDTWVLSTGGSGWVNMTPSGASPTPSAGAMVWDTVHQVILLETPDSNTWTWDGTSWTNVSLPAAGPPARGFPGMAFDSIRGVAVLFGGCSTPGNGPIGCNTDGGLLNDTWQWDGTQWTQVGTGTDNLPNQRGAPAMAFDPGRGVTTLVGGFESSGGVVDTWEWTGTGWVESLTETSLPGRFMTNLVYDPVRAGNILLGGCTALNGSNPCAGTVADVWRWDGSNYNLLNLDGADPGVPAGSPGVVYDSNQGADVFFGPVQGPTVNTNDVYQLGYMYPAWILANPDSARPPARFDFSMAFDTIDNWTMMFGGYEPDGAINLADTWSFNGSTWNNLAPATTPPARRNHSLSYDSSRGTAVLFGGFESGVVNDTWEFQSPQTVNYPDGGVAQVGGNWTAIESPDGGSPPARDQHMMTFDQGQAATVLFGGTSDGTNANLTDTWKYTGAGWTQLSPATSPTARQDAAFVYDTTRGVDLLFGGLSNNTATNGFNDLWEWDGTTWTSISTTGVAPGVGAWTGAAYDQNFGGLLVAGGQFGSTSRNETWLLTSDPTRVPLAVAQFSFAAAGAASATITQMTFNTYAGGSGNSVVTPGRGAQVPGATLGFWSNGDSYWIAPTANAALPSTPGQLTYTTGSPGEAQDYLYTPTQTINLAIIPAAGGRGNGLSPTEIGVDYIEVTVSYVQGSVGVVGPPP